MAGKSLLLVEGIDDRHVVYAIRDAHGIDEKAFKVEDKQGIDNLFEGFELNLIEGSSSIARIGIVIDADIDLKARWQKTLRVLERAGYGNMPAAPDPEGFIIRQEFKPTVGVWIMPDNRLHGMLEDFLRYLVPDGSKLWAKAVEATGEALLIDEETFSEIHLAKARIHTFLAWQKEPGKPFGTAITARYLRADAPESHKFAEWLRQLFS